MSNFDVAFNTIKDQEGGYVNDAHDGGGPTNCGISLRWYRTIHPEATESTIKNLTMEEIVFLYRTYWWNINKYFLIDAQTVASKVFSLSINMGPHQAHKLLQRACWSIYGHGCISDDGLLGSVTLALINKTLAPTLLAALRSEAAGYYRTLAAESPRTAEFLKGWLNRAYA